jgi:hypothetical protein
MANGKWQLKMANPIDLTLPLSIHHRPDSFGGLPVRLTDRVHPSVMDR